MRIAQLIAVLQRLPPDAEIGVLAASAIARPPVVQRIKADAGWREENKPTHRGFVDPDNAYLIRPAQEIIA